MGERSAEPIQLPDHEGVTLLQVREAGLESRPVVAGARHLVDEQMALVDAGGEQRPAPQVDRLPSVLRAHPLVSHQNVRTTPRIPFFGKTIITPGFGARQVAGWSRRGA